MSSPTTPRVCMVSLLARSPILLITSPSVNHCLHACPLATARTGASDISPETLTVRRYAQFAGMLSLRQIGQMLQSPHSAESSSLIRYRFSRFSSVLVNILVLVITLPSFLLREPSNLLRQSVISAAIAIPCMFGAVLGMMAELPGIPPVAGVFIPVFILIPIALGRVTFIRT